MIDFSKYVAQSNSLNPYYTGSYSMRFKLMANNVTEECLNPYYTGSYSMRSSRRHVLVCLDTVLILIILEVTLWDQRLCGWQTGCKGLNPYYTGSYSMRIGSLSSSRGTSSVLILIILEVTLWVTGSRDIL